MESILNTIKNMLDLPNTDDSTYDTQLVLLINSAFATLTDLGAGPSEGFRIYDSSEEWLDFETTRLVDFVKEYIYLRVKVVFDPPQSQMILEAYKQEISEKEWRIGRLIDERNAKNG